VKRASLKIGESVIASLHQLSILASLVVVVVSAHTTTYRLIRWGKLIASGILLMTQILVAPFS